MECDNIAAYRKSQPQISPVANLSSDCHTTPLSSSKTCTLVRVQPLFCVG
jgi:hypothetical protein